MMNSSWLSFKASWNRIYSASSAHGLELAPIGLVAFRRDRSSSAGILSGRAGQDRQPAIHLWSDAAKFVFEWLRHPNATAAIAPSGKALASLITREIDGSVGRVLELGPGTGVFTRALVERGVAERNLTLVEQSPSFAGLLKTRFPTSTVLDIDAAELDRIGASPVNRIGAVVCGLGLRNMDPSQVEEIIRGSFAMLAPRSFFYLFTYGLRCSVPDDVLDNLGLTAEKIGSTLRNLPPATVYRLRRTAEVQ